MTTTTKLAFVRGIAQNLQMRGHTQFGSDEILKEASDYIGVHLNDDPLFVEIDDETVAKIASALIEISEDLQPNFKAASHQENAFFTDETFDNDLLVKIAAAAEEDLYKIAAGQPVDGMPMQNNSISQAAQHSHMAKRESMERPEGYANSGQGRSEMENMPGTMVGQEMAHPKQQMNQGGSRKESSVRNLLHKLAMGETGQHGASPSTALGDNSIEAAAQQSQMGRSEAERRPTGYANEGQGNSSMSGVPGSAVGTEMPHPHSGSSDGAASNSAIEETKTSSWQQHFQATYEQLRPVFERSDLSMEDQTTVTKHAMQLEPRQLPGFTEKFASELGIDMRPQAPKNTLGDLLSNLSLG